MIEDILKHNKQFVENKGYEKYITNKYPDKKIAILSCMDTRLTELLPAALGIKNGDVKMIKNAGGIISHPFGSVIRSLMVAIYELGVKEVMVIAHSDCGACHMSSPNDRTHESARYQAGDDRYDTFLRGGFRLVALRFRRYGEIRPGDGKSYSGTPADSGRRACFRVYHRLDYRSLESCGGINGYDYPYGCIPLTGYWREPSFFFHCICRPLPYDGIVLKAL